MPLFLVSPDDRLLSRAEAADVADERTLLSVRQLVLVANVLREESLRTHRALEATPAAFLRDVSLTSCAVGSWTTSLWSCFWVSKVSEKLRTNPTEWVRLTHAWW